MVCDHWILLFDDVQIYKEVLDVYRHDNFECICHTKERKVKQTGYSQFR